jgi:hypothetical protein
LIARYPKQAPKQPAIVLGTPMPIPMPNAILLDRLIPESFVVVGDIDVVMGDVNVVVEDVEERSALEGLPLLVLDDEADFSGEFEAVRAPAEVGVVEIDSRDPGEDVAGVAVVVAAAAFLAG